MAALTKPIVTTCSGCCERVTVDADAGTATVVVPSNGLRGAKHVPAHTEVADVVVEDLLMWDCPACGYADSFDLVDGVNLR